MNFISQAASTTGTHEGMHDGERTAGAWQEGGDGRNARRGTHVGGMAGGRARQGGMAGGMEGGHDRGA